MPFNRINLDTNKYIFKENTVFFHSSQKMYELQDNSIDLIITSPPYFNIKNYSKDGKQQHKHSESKKNDIGNYSNFDDYINNLLPVWKECERVLTSNGKLCVNVPLIPLLKKHMNTHYNRDIFDLQASIQQDIIKNTNLFLMDLYIWNRTNTTKHLMFGSYPYPRNFYTQNTCEFITIFTKDGKPKNVSNNIKEKSKLTKKEWLEYTKQIWNIQTPNKSDIAFGIHPAIMPEEIVKRLVKLYSFVDDIVLDPFAGSGTTLKVAKELNRNYVGYEIYEYYRDIINKKLGKK